MRKGGGRAGLPRKRSKRKIPSLAVFCLPSLPDFLEPDDARRLRAFGGRYLTVEEKPWKLYL